MVWFYCRKVVCNYAKLNASYVMQALDVATTLTDVTFDEGMSCCGRICFWTQLSDKRHVTLPGGAVFGYQQIIGCRMGWIYDRHWLEEAEIEFQWQQAVKQQHQRTKSQSEVWSASRKWLPCQCPGHLTITYLNLFNSATPSQGQNPLKPMPPCHHWTADNFSVCATSFWRASHGFSYNRFSLA